MCVCVCVGGCVRIYKHETHKKETQLKSKYLKQTNDSVEQMWVVRLTCITMKWDYRETTTSDRDKNLQHQVDRFQDTNHILAST